MILRVVKYGEPVLRKKGTRVEAVTPEIQELVANMLETMYDANGIGLAAQQVGHTVQVTVLDLRSVTDRPSKLFVDGEETEIDRFMPLVLINPELTPVGDTETGPEGCLSFPEIYGEVVRPEGVEVKAMNDKGESLAFRCEGLLARAIQHETDHLHGILFIDRMKNAAKREIQSELDELHAQTKADQKKKKAVS